MGAQDRTEQVLREIHVLFSKAQPVNNSKTEVIINKSQAMDLLKELNECMYEMMEEYELTVQSQEKSKRKRQKEGDEIVFEASRKAEDIYAASVMYTDNALSQIQEIIQHATEDVGKIFETSKKQLEEEKRNIRKNQTELKSQLQDLIDTQKYIKLIEEENYRRKKEEAKGEMGYSDEKPMFADVKPEIRINKDYFAAAGIPVEEEETVKEEDISQKDMMNELDQEYFAWKKEENQEEKTEKKGGFSFFGKR